MKMLRDSFGRTFPYIRLSITDVCNFKCGYCLPNGYQKDNSDNRKFLSAEEIGRLAKGLSELGVWFQSLKILSLTHHMLRLHLN